MNDPRRSPRFRPAHGPPAMFLLASLCLLTATAAAAAGATVATVPFQIERNKILVPVSINGSESYDFLLDTGSPMTLVALPELAAPMRLAPTERIVINGAGRGNRRPGAAVAWGATVSIGGVRLADQRVVVLDRATGLSAYFGFPTHGILGRALFDRYVVEIDFERRLLTLHDPATFRYLGAGERLPIRLEGGHPHLDGTVVLGDGTRRQLDLVLDTGASAALTLIENPGHGITPPAGATAIRLGRGLRGEIHGAVARVPRLELGRLVVRDVVAGFAPRRSGIAPNGGANLGAEVLRRFRVIFNYGRRWMILEPNAAFGQPFEADMSGLVVRAEGDAFDRLVIEQVRRGSPAARAGLTAGDRLLAIAGRPAEAFSLGELTELLRRREGLVIPLTVERDGERVEVQIELERVA